MIAVWEYDDTAAYERIDAAVRADVASVKAQERRNRFGLLFTEKHETLARSIPQDAGRQ